MIGTEIYIDLRFKLIRLLAATVCCCALITGCAHDPWIGSVDTVFRYRPKETSTVVFEIRPDSLSEKAGIKPGDVLLAVDGKDITNASYKTVRAALRGPIGTEAVLTIKRGTKIMDVVVERLRTNDDKKGKNDKAGT